MSQAVASGSHGDTGAEAGLPLDQRPLTAGIQLMREEGNKLDYYVTYTDFGAQEGDQVTWSIQDSSDGEGMYMRMEVRRKGSERVAYIHESNTVPLTVINLRENLQTVNENPQKVDLKKKWCKVQLKKKVPFALTPYFKTRSPSTNSD